jgi:hypothetical protein
MDSAELCRDPKHYQSYPHEIEYRYNDRGYRDDAWPSNVEQAIWCIGDSFTVGIGSPRQHTWPYLLQQAVGQRTINVSMDGASNNWIARQAIRVMEQIRPTLMILHWSYVNRREKALEPELDESWDAFYNNVRDASWPTCRRQDRSLLPEHIQQELTQVHGGWKDPAVPDDGRLIHYERCTDEDDISNTLDCINRVNQAAAHTRVIHSFIPDFVPAIFKGRIELQISGLVIPETVTLDLARDGHHYDRATARWLVDQIQRLL